MLMKQSSMKKSTYSESKFGGQTMSMASSDARRAELARNHLFLQMLSPEEGLKYGDRCANGF